MKPRTKTVLWYLLALTLSAAFSSTWFDYTPSEFLIPTIIYEFLAGWFLFPIHVLPRLTLNAPAVIAFFICLALLIVGVHRFLAWLRVETSTDAIQPWRWRSTLLLGALALVVLTMCISSGLVFHQFGWFITNKRPSVKATMSVYPHGLFRAAFPDRAMEAIADDPKSRHWDEQHFLNDAMTCPSLELYHIGFVHDDAGKLIGAFVGPRTQSPDRLVDFVVVYNNRWPEQCTPADLPRRLQELRVGAR